MTALMKQLRYLLLCVGLTLLGWPSLGHAEFLRRGVWWRSAELPAARGPGW